MSFAATRLRRRTVAVTSPIVVLALAGAISLGVSACGSDAGSIAAQARSGDGKG
jgi:hypothetical protein